MNNSLEASPRDMSPQVHKQAQPVPRRFRTAFIIFSSVRHKEIRQQLGHHARTEKTANISKLVSSEWRSMSSQQKQIWKERACQDKLRYNQEMNQYKEYVKTHSNSTAEVPKRPMSAYLAFSNKRRGALKRLYPDATNAELSKMLAKAWKEADPAVKAEYVEEEARLRAQYNIDMVPFRNKKPRKSKAKQAIHQDMRMEAPLGTDGFFQQFVQSPSPSSPQVNVFGLPGNTPPPQTNCLGLYSPNDPMSGLLHGATRAPPEPLMASDLGPSLASADEELLQQLDTAKQELIRKIRARRQNLGLVNTHTQFQQKQLIDQAFVGTGFGGTGAASDNHLPFSSPFMGLAAGGNHQMNASSAEQQLRRFAGQQQQQQQFQEQYQEQQQSQVEDFSMTQNPCWAAMSA